VSERGSSLRWNDGVDSDAHKIRMMLKHKTAVVITALLTAPAAFAADGYPSRPLRMIVPFPPGGGTDIMARMVGQRLTDAFGVQVVVDNRGGAGGIIGTDLAARATPDGHTMMIGSVSTICLNAALHKKLPFDSEKDLAPISLVASTPSLLVVGNNVAAKSVKELIALAKAKPGQLHYATPGSGSSSHLGSELFKQAAGVDIQHVPYKGTGPAVTDLVSGQVAMFITNMPSVLPMVKANRLRALAVTSLTRTSLMPELPTVAESGIPGFEVIVWYGVFAPAATPRPIVARLHQEISKLATQQDVKDRLALQGAEVITSTPEELARRVRDDLAKWGKIVRASGIKAD
jgi:tripartite-type tricarboxylate transporter receptor subunit TctC